jgi:hypothetical protein
MSDDVSDGPTEPSTDRRGPWPRLVAAALAVILSSGVAAALTRGSDGSDGDRAERAETTTTTRGTTTSTMADTTTTTADGSTTTTTDDVPPPPTFPPGQADPSEGATTWAVVLAAEADPDDPVLAEAVRDAARAGYRTRITDCDAGAAELFGSVEGYYTVSVYFADEATARLAADVFATRHVSATPGQIEAGCPD